MSVIIYAIYIDVGFTRAMPNAKAHIAYVYDMELGFLQSLSTNVIYLYRSEKKSYGPIVLIELVLLKGVEPFFISQFLFC